jgi:Ca2+-binding EF-hand superfamily protein
VCACAQGKIDVAALRKVSAQLQLPVEEEELVDMVAEFDKDGDGMISLQEFAAIMGAYDE